MVEIELRPIGFNSVADIWPTDRSKIELPYSIDRIPNVRDSAIVELTISEIVEFRAEGDRRFDRAEKGGWTTRNKGEREISQNGLMANHIYGAGGEKVVSKYFGLEWTGKKAFGAVDVGGGVFPLEVRTPKRSGFRIWAYQEGETKQDGTPKDQDEDIIVGVWPVVGTNFHVWLIVGWNWVSQFRKPEFLDDPQGKGAKAYYVAPFYLRGVSELWPLVLAAKWAKDGVATKLIDDLDRGPE